MKSVKFVKTPADWQWLCAVGLAATIVCASGQGQVAGPDVVNFDKVVHFSVFGLLATLVLRATGANRWWLALVIVSVFGATDELHQSFTPGRSMDYHDWIADTLGAVLAVTLYVKWPWYRRLLERPFGKRKPKVEAATVSATTVAAL